MSENILPHALNEDVEAREKDWRFGGVSGVTKHVLREDGDYTAFLPEKELQKSTLETMACVNFSALNVLETIAKVYGIHLNLSDRFTAKMSGTTKRGNSFYNVGESIRTDGVVDEAIWPFDRANKNLTWEEYYAEIPEQVRKLAKEFLVDYDINYEWVTPDKFEEALKYGPLQVGVYAWPKPLANGMYNEGGTDTRNHAVMLFNKPPEFYEIYDSYDKVVKHLVPTYKFRSGVQYSINPKAELPMMIENDILVQEVEKSGSFGLHLNGKILLGPVDEILATWLMRNKGSVSGRTKSLLKAQWDEFPKFDLKNNPLS